MKFECIQEIKNLLLPSKCLKQFNTKFILSTEVINIIIYIYNKRIDFDKVLKAYIYFIDEIFILRNEYIFLGGKNKVILLWNFKKFLKINKQFI